MKLVNYSKWDASPYCEIGQENPLRWMNIKRVDKDTYEPVSHWWRCKDFMNEVVTSGFTGKTYNIYGFTVDPAKFFDSSKTLTFLLKNVGKAFEHNLQIVNDYLVTQGMATLSTKKHEDFYVVALPKVYQENTLFMSQITLFIRLASCDVPCSSLDKMAQQPVNTGDRANLDAALKKPMGSFPEHLKKYIWYYNDTQNLPKDEPEKKFYTSHMHNCGVVSWGGYGVVEDADEDEFEKEEAARFF